MANISFRDPDTFNAGEIHKNFDTWKVILESYEQQERVLQWISKGVNVVNFMRPFKGMFRDVQYDL